MDRVVKNAREQGWTHRFTERGHHQFLAANGKDIVHAAGTPSDQRGWQNFMGDMRRAGYQSHPNGATLGEVAGDLLQRANGSAEVKAAGAQVSARDVVRDQLRQHPEGMGIGAITEVFRKLRPETHPNNVSAAMSQLVSRGEVVRMEAKGHYRLATEEDKRRAAIGAAPKAPPSATGTPSNCGSCGGPLTESRDPKIYKCSGLHAVSVAKMVAPVQAAALSTGDDQIDSELAELDAAVTQVLDGFTTLERLLRRHRETMRALAQVKKMLAGMGSLK